jgi:hypothetical protein
MKVRMAETRGDRSPVTCDTNPCQWVGTTAAMRPLQKDKECGGENGGEREIRTPGEFPHAPFPRVCTRPLCDLSRKIRNVAETRGDRSPVTCDTHPSQWVGTTATMRPLHVSVISSAGDSRSREILLRIFDIRTVWKKAEKSRKNATHSLGGGQEDWVERHSQSETLSIIDVNSCFGKCLSIHSHIL